VLLCAACIKTQMTGRDIAEFTWLSRLQYTLVAPGFGAGRGKGMENGSSKDGRNVP
jgi:hypothetical protein